MNFPTKNNIQPSQDIPKNVSRSQYTAKNKYPTYTLYFLVTWLVIKVTLNK